MASILLSKYSFDNPPVSLWWINVRLYYQVKMFAYNTICYNREPHLIEGGWELMMVVIDEHTHSKNK